MKASEVSIKQACNYVDFLERDPKSYNTPGHGFKKTDGWLFGLSPQIYIFYQ